MTAERTEKAASAAATISDAPTWDQALGRALGELGDALTSSPDLVLLFASPAYAPAFVAMAPVTQARTGARVLIGCSGQGIIGAEREIEDRPALSVLGAVMPGATLKAVHVSQPFVAAAGSAEDWHRLTGLAPEEVNAWLIFSDPFSLDV